MNTAINTFFKKKIHLKKKDFFWKEFYLYLIENKLDLITCVLVS